MDVDGSYVGASLYGVVVKLRRRVKEVVLELAIESQVVLGVFVVRCAVSVFFEWRWGRGRVGDARVVVCVEALVLRPGCYHVER